MDGQFRPPIHDFAGALLAGERWTVRRFNDTAHLADDLSRVGVPLT